jgi:hypothetical protein
MPVFEIQHPDGSVYEADAPDHDTALAGFRKMYNLAGEESSGLGLLKSAGTGLAEGMMGIAGLPGLAQKGVKAAFDYFGAPVADPRAPNINPPNPEEIQRSVEGQTGALYQPQNRGERYVKSIASMVPGMGLGVGPTTKALTSAILPGVLSEGAADVASKYSPGAEPYARLGGALASGPIGAAAKGMANYYRSNLAAQDIGKLLGEPVSGGAVRRLASNVEADELTPKLASETAAKYGGDNAMLLDLGRQLKMRAEAVAQQPGKGQNILYNAAEERTGQFGGEAAARIKDTMDQHFGPVPNVEELKTAIHNMVQAQAKPAYDAVMSKHPVLEDDTLKTLAKRPVIAQAIKDAGGLAANYGEKLDPQMSLRNWDYVKKSLDARINGVMRNGGMETLDSKQKADLGGMMDARRSLRDHLDNLTNDEYKNARNIAATEPELKEALESGRGMLNTRLLTEEAKKQFDDMSIPEQSMARAGMRREIDRIIDVSRNDGATARRLLDTNANREKISTFFGEKSAKALDDRIAAETHYQDVTTGIKNQSHTYQFQQMGKDTAERELGELPEESKITLPGIVIGGGRKLTEALMSHGTDLTRESIARMLTTKGPQRDQIAKALMEYNKRKFSAPEGGPLISPRTKGLAAALAGNYGIRNGRIVINPKDNSKEKH